MADFTRDMNSSSDKTSDASEKQNLLNSRTLFPSLRAVWASPLGRKSVLIVVIPLAFSILFVVSLRYLLQEASNAADREARSRDVVFRANMFGSEIIQVGAAYYITRSGGGRDSFIAKVEKVRRNFSELEKLVPPKSKRGKLLAKTRISLEKLYTVLTTRWEKKYQNAELFNAEDSQGVRDVMKDLLSSTVKDMNEVVFEEIRERRRHPMTSAKYRDWIDIFLIGGVAANVVLGLALIAYFSTGISRRLQVLTDNSQRLADGQDLMPVVSGNDEISHLDKVFHDMADRLNDARRKEREFLESIQLSEARLRSIIDTIPLGLVIVDEQSKVKILSPSAENLFGCSSDDFAEHQVSELFSSSGRATQSIPLSPTELDFRKSRELQARRKDGSHFPVEVLATEYNTSDMRGRLLIITDITQKYEIDKLKQGFVSMVSHELRSPLMSIQLCMTMIARGFFGELNEEGVNSVRLAEKSAQRLIALVNEILDVERLESGTISISSQRASLRSMLELAIGSVKSLAEKNAISIESSVPDLYVQADQDRVVQVIINLISNAIKFSPQGAKILIDCHSQDNYARVSVKDFGRGIPDDHLELIFNRFHQVKTTDASEKGGTGLGLAISKAIIEAHHGEIGVESIFGQGSTFWFTLALDADDDEM